MMSSLNTVPSETSASLGFKSKETKAGKHEGEGPKEKGVSAEPHPLDKHSGTGRGKELSKGGHGKGNWGDFKDDLRFNDEGEDQDVEQERNEASENTDKVPEKAPLVLAPKKDSKEIHVEDEKEFPSLK